MEKKKQKLLKLQFKTRTVATMYTGRGYIVYCEPAAYSTKVLNIYQH